MNNGDKEPHDITHVPGQPKPPKSLPHAGVSFKSFVKLVADPHCITPPEPKNLPD